LGSCCGRQRLGPQTLGTRSWSDVGSAVVAGRLSQSARTACPRPNRSRLRQQSHETSGREASFRLGWLLLSDASSRLIEAPTVASAEGGLSEPLFRTSEGDEIGATVRAPSARAERSRSNTRTRRPRRWWRILVRRGRRACMVRHCAANYFLGLLPRRSLRRFDSSDNSL
jgi:hypothetical protein